MAAASDIPESEIVGRALLDVFAELSGGPAEGALRRALGGATTVWAHRFHRYLLPLPAPSGDSRLRAHAAERAHHADAT
jgi:hypothetical protein